MEGNELRTKLKKNELRSFNCILCQEIKMKWITEKVLKDRHFKAIRINKKTRKVEVIEKGMW